MDIAKFVYTNPSNLQIINALNKDRILFKSCENAVDKVSFNDNEDIREKLESNTLNLSFLIKENNGINKVLSAMYRIHQSNLFGGSKKKKTTRSKTLSVQRGRVTHTGKRGGKYYIVAGKKVYIKL